ncbi:MAG: bacterial transcriptional activator domain-containing protein, partial [Myxococcota bacterium]
MHHTQRLPLVVSRLHMHNPLLWTALGLLLMGTTACPRPGVTPVGPPALGPDLRTLPAAGTAAAAWHTWIAEGDTTTARASFTDLAERLDIPPSPDQPQPPRALVRFGQAELAHHQGEHSAALARHLELLTEAPDDPLSAWSAAQVVALRDYAAGWSEDVIRTADALVDRPISPEARAYMGHARTIARYRVQLRSKQPGLWNGAPDGFSQYWRQAGPFSIYPLLDETRAFPEVEAQERLPASSSTRGFTLPSRTLVLDQPRFNPSYDTTGIYYIETWLQVRAPTEAIVHLNTTSALTLWLDDAKLIERRLTEGYPRTQYGTRVMLDEGVHRIRIRLAVQNVEEPFTLFLTPTSGKDAPFVFSDTPPQGSPRGGVEVLERDLFEPLSAEASRGHPFMLWLKARAEISAGLHDRALVTLAALEALAPEFPQVTFQQGNAHRDDATQAINLRQEQALGLYRQTVERDPQALFATDRLAFMLYTQGQLDEALALLDDLALKLTDSYVVQYHRYLLFRDKGWEPHMRTALRRALELSPTNCTLVAAQWELWRGRESTPAPDNIPAEFYGCDITWENLATAHDLPRGDLEAAIGRYQHLVERNPSLTGYREVLARLLEHKGDRQAAARQYEAIRARLLDPTYLDVQQTDATLAASGAKATRSFLTRRLAERPGSYELRRQLARLDSQRVLDDLHIDGMDLIQRHLA